MTYLQIDGPDGFHVNAPLESEPLSIGRDSGCDILIEDRLVSRQHVSVAPGFIVQDLESFNGVYVRGKRVQRAFLFQGESFRIGSKGTYVAQIVGRRLPGSEREFDPDSTISDARAHSPTPAASRATHVLDSKELEDRLAELARENEQLRRQLAALDPREES